MASPLLGRRSRKIAPIDRCNDEEVPSEELHNVDEERDRSRKQVENELVDHGSPSSNKRLSYLDKSATEHFQSCIQLAAENKINVKNAFSFKLIDLLFSKFSKKKTIKDFTEVSSSLDAGVKIYSCRVDNVHSDTMRMATSICNVKNKKTRSDSENEEQDADPKNEKRRIRKIQKATLASKMDIINRSKTGETCRFAQNSFGTDRFVMESAIFDGRRVRWHLELKSKFWQKNDNVPPKTNNISIDIPDFPENVTISQQFKNFRFGANDPDFPKTKAEINSTVFDFNTTINNDIHDDSVPFDDDGIVDVPLSEGTSLPKSHLSCLSKMMSSSDFVSDITKLISSETSDYRYFNINSLQKNWTSKNLKHWNPLRQKKGADDRKSRVEKKEPIDFNTFNDTKEIFDEKRKHNNISNYIIPREKLLITPITRFNLEEFFRLKVWREMFIIPSSTNNEDQPSDLEEMINDYDYNNPNDSQNFLPEQHEDDYNDDDCAPHDVHEAIDRNAFMGENLLEIPNKVSKVQLPYLIKDKSVNMKQLKSEIWNKIEVLEDGKTEKQAPEDGIPFSNICQSIISKDCKTIEELSVPILFNAILQLANDRNLVFLKDKSNSLADFVIMISD